MAYEAHEWTTGEIITAEQMNNLENAVQEAVEDIESLQIAVDGRVAYAAQDKNDELKAAARSNIGAAEQTAFSTLQNDTKLYLFQLRRASVIEKAYVQWESGALNSSTGENTGDNSDRQIRSGFLLAAPGEEIQFTGISTDRLAIVCSYDKDKSFIAGSRKSFLSLSGQTYTVPTDTYYVRFIYGFAAGTGQTITGYGGVDAVAADWDISCVSAIEKDMLNSAASL